MTARKPLRFLCGRAGSGKSTAVLHELTEALQTGREVYLLVPEQGAVVWETLVAKTVDPTLTLNLHIVNFSRLCNLLSRKLGGLSYRYITKGAKAALLYDVLRALSPSLSFYGKHKRLDRSVPAIAGAISEMKRYAVTPADLSRAAGELSKDEDCARIAARLSDLSLLYGAYNTAISQNFDDDEEELAHLATRLAETDFFAGAFVFVDSFFSLTPTENEILTHIFRQAEGVTVTFACPFTDTKEAHLSAPRKFLSSALRSADRVGRDYEVVAFTENRRAESEELRHLEAYLWNFDAAPLMTPDKPDSVRVITAADRYAEAEAAAARIMELVRGGARYGDIAVIARRADPLYGILDRVFDREGIPYFLSAPASVDTRPVARLLFAALSIVSGGFAREDVLLLAKTGLCGLTDDEADAFESYVETWKLWGETAFESDFTANPDGYAANVSARGKKLLALANAGREKLITPLLPFAALFREAKDGCPPVREVSRGLYELLCAYGVWDSLTDQAKRLREAGRKREADETDQLWGILMNALDTLVQVLPEGTADATAYASLLRQVLAAARVGAIPCGIDSVTVGEAGGIRLGEVPHVLILGAAEGEFPGTPAADGFFSDTDRIRLEGVGINLAPTSDEGMREELFWFYRAVSLPRKTLTVFYPLTDGNALSPSTGVERILTLLPALTPEKAEEADAAHRIYSAASAKAALRRGDGADLPLLSRLGYALTPAALPLSAREERIGEETAAALFPKAVTLTQSRLDAFVRCRFGYFCQYVARLEEPTRATLSAVNVGTFVHRILELFFDRIKGRPLPLPEEELLAIADELVGDCVREILPPSTKNGRAFYLFARLKRGILPILRSLSGEFAQSRFVPEKFELNVGFEEGAVPPLRIPLSDGRSAFLRGTIDRVDVFREGDTAFVRVVDYKTGKKLFSEKDLPLGLNLQLFLYLFSLIRCPEGPLREELTGGARNLRPAGAYYFSSRPGESTSPEMLDAHRAALLTEKDIQRSGIFLSEELPLLAQEKDLMGKYIPIKQKAGVFKGDTLLSAEEFEALESTMTNVVARLSEEMIRGDARAIPLDKKDNHGNDPCEYCAMYAVCRSAGKESTDDAE